MSFAVSGVRAISAEVSASASSAVRLSFVPVIGTTSYWYVPPRVAVKSRQLNFCTGHTSVVSAFQLLLSPPCHPTHAGRGLKSEASFKFLRRTEKPRHLAIGSSYC